MTISGPSQQEGTGQTQMMPAQALLSGIKGGSRGPDVSLRLRRSGRLACLSALNSAPQQNVTPLDSGQCLLLWLQRETDKDPGSSSLTPWVGVTLWWVSTGSRIFFCCSLLHREKGLRQKTWGKTRRLGVVVGTTLSSPVQTAYSNNNTLLWLTYLHCTGLLYFLLCG